VAASSNVESLCASVDIISTSLLRLARSTVAAAGHAA